MGYMGRALGLATALFALATGTASATTLRFEGAISLANWVYWFGDPARDLMCAGSCVDNFEQATGLDFSSSGSLYIDAVGTLRFMVNAETNEVLTSEIRVGDWTTELPDVNFNGGSFAGCAVGPTVQWGQWWSGTSFLTCKLYNQYPPPIPDPIQSYQDLWNSPPTQCGGWESCGLLVGTGWRMNIKSVDIRPVQVPGPGTLVLLSSGLLGIGVMRRKAA